MGKELDDSLGVEKSGRVPSGPYNMHIDLFVILILIKKYTSLRYPKLAVE